MRAGEAATSPRRDGIHAFIVSELQAVQAHQPAAGERRSTEALDDLLRDCVLDFERARSNAAAAG